MTKQFIPSQGDTPPDLLEIVGGPFREDVQYIRLDLVAEIIAEVAFHWRNETPITRAGVCGRAAVGICEKMGWEYEKKP